MKLRPGTKVIPQPPPDDRQNGEVALRSNKELEVLGFQKPEYEGPRANNKYTDELTSLKVQATHGQDLLPSQMHRQEAQTITSGVCLPSNT